MSAVSIHAVADDSAVRVDVLPAQGVGAEAAARVSRVWEELCAANDRLYDGPMLRVVSVDPEAGHVVCRRDTFRSLATSARLGLGVRQLGVMGVLIGRDAAGNEHLLLGRRAADTRIYPGLWEVAPSGGVKPPPPDVERLGLRELGLALAEEAEEELGMVIDPGAVRLAGLLRDDAACSDDAVLRVKVPGCIDPRAAVCAIEAEHTGRWEYIDTAWIALTDLRVFVREHARAIALPTAELIRTLGWC